MMTIQARQLLGRNTKWWHAVEENFAAPLTCNSMALCGAQPRMGSKGWSYMPGFAVTCPRCQRVMRKILDKDQLKERDGGLIEVLR